MSQAPALPCGTISITTGVNPSSAEGRGISIPATRDLPPPCSVSPFPSVSAHHVCPLPPLLLPNPSLHKSHPAGLGAASLFQVAKT